MSLILPDGVRTSGHSGAGLRPTTFPPLVQVPLAASDAPRQTAPCRIRYAALGTVPTSSSEEAATGPITAEVSTQEQLQATSSVIEVEELKAKPSVIAPREALQATSPATEVAAAGSRLDAPTMGETSVGRCRVLSAAGLAQLQLVKGTQRVPSLRVVLSAALLLVASIGASVISSSLPSRSTVSLRAPFATGQAAGSPLLGATRGRP